MHLVFMTLRVYALSVMIYFRLLVSPFRYSGWTLRGLWKVQSVPLWTRVTVQLFLTTVTVRVTFVCSRRPPLAKKLTRWVVILELARAWNGILPPTSLMCSRLKPMSALPRVRVTSMLPTVERRGRVSL